MARSTPSRKNLFGFGKKRKPARKRKASAKTKRRMFGWLTDKRETYRRSAKDERSEMAARAKAERAQLRADEAAIKKEELAERRARLERKRADAADRKIEREWREKGYRNPSGCARTLKTKVTDRAQRYRANQKSCRPAGVKKCKLCGSRSDVMTDHIDGREENNRKSNLRWLCRSCNNTLGAEMAKAGQGRRTVQYNPAHKGARTLGEYMQAVLEHTRGAHDAAGKIIHDTPKSRRREFASEIWARRESHGTARGFASGASGREPDWVTNPAASAAQYRLAQAVLSGTARTPTRMTRKVAQEIVDSTPAHLRSEYMRSNPHMDLSSTEYRLGYNLGQTDRQMAALRKTPGELHATFVANFGAIPTADWLAFDQAYQAGFGGNIGVAAPNPAWRNPASDLEDDGSDDYKNAKRIAELFHGRPVKEEITVRENIRSHDWYASIGPLVKLKVKTIRKQRATFPFSLKGDAMVHLFCSPDGRQFYLRGGDQSLDLKPLGMDGKEWHRDKMVIGEVTEISYQDRKKFQSFKLVEFYHRLGEVTKIKPWMVYDTLNEKIEIVGGQYYVETEELVEGMSPGVVN
jgi:hypothetical protein